jgi:hypothetical protein
MAEKARISGDFWFVAFDANRLRYRFKVTLKSVRVAIHFRTCRYLGPVLFIARAATTSKTLEDKLKEDAKNRQMADLYRQHVLKEAPKPPVLQIQGLKKASLESRN